MTSPAPSEPHATAHHIDPPRLRHRATPADTRPALPRAPRLEDHRGTLWGLCYRMTGSAADAEDLVQETFVRALERPPRDTGRPWRPWLVRVAMNLSRDQLRRRRRRNYHGTWLPTPIETDPAPEPNTAETPETRYNLSESASYAFLLALEALSPAQRAVLLLRDAFDYSVSETAETLDLSEANVRTTHHRAKKKMASYERTRRPLTESLRDEVRSMLERMAIALSTRNLEQARSLLASDARALSDGGGVTFAAKKAVVGSDKIARMYMKLATRSSDRARFEIRTINGLPAIVADDPDPKPPNAPRAMIRVELDRDGKIRELHSVLAPNKLAAVRRVPG